MTIFADRDWKWLAVTAVLCLGLFVTSGTIEAAPFQTLDATGNPFDLAVEVKNDPDAFIDLMKDEFARGNLDSAGYFAEQLIKVRPQQADIHAVYSISLVVGGKEARAREELELARRAGPESLYTLCAEALLLQREKNSAAAIKKCEQAIALDSAHPYPHNILGRLYTDMGNLKDGLNSFKKAVELQPTFLLGHINLGATYYLAGQYDQSIASFSRAIELNADAHAAFHGLATVYETLGRDGEAIQALEKCLALNPDNLTALESLGNLQLKGGQFEAALKTGRKMEQKGMASAYILLGDASLQTGKTEEAISFLKKAPSGTPEASYLLGFCEMVEGRYESAKKLMEEVLLLEPRHFGAYSARAALKLYLGETVSIKEDLTNHWTPSLGKLLSFTAGCVQVSEQRWQEALASFQASEGMINGFLFAGIDQGTLTAGTSDKEARHLSLGVLYYFKQLSQQSLDQFSQAIEINKYSLLGNFWAAQLQLQQKDREQARNLLENAIHKAPRFFSALYTIGELYLLAGNADEAATYYRQALAVNKDAGLLIKLGLHAEQAGKYEDAASYYQQTIDAFPALFVGYNQLAWLYAKQGLELDQAMLLAQKADKLQPGNAGILDTIGWIHFQKKEFTAAIPYLEKANGITPNNPTILFHLGKALLATGKKDVGMKMLKEALSSPVPFEEAKEAQQLVDQQ